MGARKRKTAKRPKPMDSPAKSREQLESKSGGSYVKASLSLVLAIILLLVTKRLTKGGWPSSDGDEQIKDSSSPNHQENLLQISRMGSYEMIGQYPHDQNAFTQGLHTSKDLNIFYESTGLYGQSSVRKVDINTGEVLKKIDLADNLFGEGLTYFSRSDGDERLALITWKENTGIVYNLDLEEQERFVYTTTNGQGWGISYNPDEQIFFVTDGTQFLHTWDTSWRELRKVPVTLRRQDMEEPAEVQRINEIEWDSFSGTLLANVWFQDVIIRINVTTGFITDVYSLRDMHPNRSPGEDVLNGIALTETPNEVFVTGKNWPLMYRIRLIDGPRA